jgi:hypothetical protein
MVTPSNTLHQTLSRCMVPRFYLVISLLCLPAIKNEMFLLLFYFYFLLLASQKPSLFRPSLQTSRCCIYKSQYFFRVWRKDHTTAMSKSSIINCVKHSIWFSIEILANIQTLHKKNIASLLIFWVAVVGGWDLQWWSVGLRCTQESDHNSGKICSLGFQSK